MWRKPKASELPRREFWKLPLNQLWPFEWEALCDGCAKCCNRGTLFGSAQAEPCHLLDRETKRCTDYAHRHARVLTCHPVTMGYVAKAVELLGSSNDMMLPATCAYVRRFQGMPLEPWQIEKAKENLVEEELAAEHS